MCYILFSSDLPEHLARDDAVRVEFKEVLLFIIILINIISCLCDSVLGVDSLVDFNAGDEKTINVILDFANARFDGLVQAPGNLPKIMHNLLGQRLIPQPSHLGPGDVLDDLSVYV